MPAVCRRPDSAACCARKRKSIDCAFSELRAMIASVGGYGVGIEVGYRSSLKRFVIVSLFAMSIQIVYLVSP